MTELEVRDAVAMYGVATKVKLSNPAAIGAPEDQLRAPLEDLIRSLADIAGIGSENIVVVGETMVKDLHTRPDYAVTSNKALVGFIEVKAPGKAQTRGGSATRTTRNSGRSSRACQTSCTRMATVSVCGEAANWQGKLSSWEARWNVLVDD